MTNIDRLLGIRKLKGISDYQFGPLITDILFKDLEKITFKRSKNTGKIKYIYFEKKFFLSLRPTNGFFSLGLLAAQKIINETKSPKLRAVVLNDISSFIKEGRNVFCKHVVEIDEALRPKDEIIVVNQNDDLLAVGKLELPVPYVKTFTRGVGIKVRKGIEKLKNKNLD
ncbi:MAG: tRNA-guanine(15) transglycosylase [Promethearchaeota archaeon]|nr:MAG: tRNA-guanine(15) transglycosylase [Candidatus Lokiarchaeota archaeon]